MSIITFQIGNRKQNAFTLQKTDTVVKNKKMV